MSHVRMSHVYTHNKDITVTFLARPLDQTRQMAIYTVVFKQVFRVKKTHRAPMGRHKLELLASNGVHICHAI